MGEKADSFSAFKSGFPISKMIMMKYAPIWVIFPMRSPDQHTKANHYWCKHLECGCFTERKKYYDLIQDLHPTKLYFYKFDSIYCKKKECHMGGMRIWFQCDFKSSYHTKSGLHGTGHYPNCNVQLFLWSQNNFSVILISPVLISYGVLLNLEMLILKMCSLYTVGK